MKMKFVKLLTPLILVVIVFCSYGTYIIYKKVELRNNCTRIHSGDVAVEVKQDKKELDIANPIPQSIEAIIYNKDRKNIVARIIIDNHYVKSVDDLIVEGVPGPKYSKVTFNGYEAAFYSSPDSGDGFDLNTYSIFSGNKVVDVSFYKYPKNDPTFDPKNIKIIKTKEDIKQARVEECGIGD